MTVSNTLAAAWFILAIYFFAASTNMVPAANLDDWAVGLLALLIAEGNLRRD